MRFSNISSTPILMLSSFDESYCALWANVLNPTLPNKEMITSLTRFFSLDNLPLGH